MRPGEASCALPDDFDAGLYFIGRIRTPWKTRSECPRRGDQAGPSCRVEIDPRWREALQGLEGRPFLQILYFMHHGPARPRGPDAARATTGRSEPSRCARPCGPNPIASSMVKLEAIEDGALLVRGLDCLDGTPLIDVKPQD